MGYIIIRPKEPEQRDCFLGVLLPFPMADKMIEAYEDMGGPESAVIFIVRRKNAYQVSIQVYEPPDGQECHKAAP